MKQKKERISQMQTERLSELFWQAEITDLRKPQDIYLIHTLILRFDGGEVFFSRCVHMSVSVH